MTPSLPNFIPAIPEIVTLVMAAVLLMVGVFVPRFRQLPYHMAQITLIGVAWLTWYVFVKFDSAATAVTFNQSFILDHLSIVLKLFIYVSVFFVFLYSREYNQDRKIPTNEFYVLGLLSML